MKKRIISILLAAMMTLCLMPVLHASAAAGQLTGLTHNCPNTGEMLPKAFDPNVYSYVLTVADWVSNVSLTPTANGLIYINGQLIASGTASPYFRMTNEPQMAVIQVVEGSYTSTYTVFLQRRPGRTRVSAGYINEIYVQNNQYYIGADLVTVNYKSSKYTDGNRSTFINDSSYIYRYAAHPHCVYYYMKNGVAVLAKDIFEFQNNSQPGAMYKIVYLEDKIVSVTPYESDY